MQKEFLQSDEWRKFQEAFGRRTFSISSKNFSASIIEHNLPIVGKYFYIPKGPIFKGEDKEKINELIELARSNSTGWIRFDPADEKMLKAIKNITDLKIVKAPHDVQPKQLFVIDISVPEEEILAKMKSKTRYNIRLAEKKDIKIKTGKEYLEDFLRLTKVMARRQGIIPHPDEYYRKMLEIIPENILKLYVAEYENKIIAANLMVFYGDTAIYLHGASDDEYRNMMAPHLLQWQAIWDAKKAGCRYYDFGGIRTDEQNNTWAGITRFKLGFSPETKPTEFPGSYDIIINSRKYWLYRFMQKIKAIF